MAEYFDRYGKFRSNGSMKPIPGIYLDNDQNDNLFSSSAYHQNKVIPLEILIFRSMIPKIQYFEV